MGVIAVGKTHRATMRPSGIGDMPESVISNVCDGHLDHMLVLIC